MGMASFASNITGQPLRVADGSAFSHWTETFRFKNPPERGTQDPDRAGLGLQCLCLCDRSNRSTLARPELRAGLSFSGRDGGLWNGVFDVSIQPKLIAPFSFGLHLPSAQSGPAHAGKSGFSRFFLSRSGSCSGNNGSCREAGSVSRRA